MKSCVLLRAAGVALLVVTDRGLPRVVHWGADPGELSAGDAASLIAAEQPPVVPNSPDEPLVLGVIPEARYGWLGKPGLIGSRQGREWSPDWRVSEVWLDDAPVQGYICAGAGRLRYQAVADGLALTIRVELLESGLVRVNAMLTNTSSEPYQLDELTLALPVPSDVREVLDFAGRWGAERMPQRSPFGVGQHRREGRRGRTGTDSAYILHAGEPSFSYSRGQVWAVHTAWSGNHLHYA